MPSIPIEQAIYGNPEGGGFRFLAKSPGFLDEWLPLAEKLCTGFGERPAGVACPGCVFAQPFGPRHVAVVQVADLGHDDANRPGALGFRLLILPRQAYCWLSGDPFLVADRLPPPWQERGQLQTLTWPEEPLPSRTVVQVQQALQKGDSSTLLGGAQALIDAGRLVFERPEPAPDLLRRIWLLLPTSSRCDLWPASFAFGNALKFDVLVVPRADPEKYADYVREEQAGDYPEGRYELSLQIAAEAGDQQEVDALFARRSSSQTFRLGLIVLAVTAFVAVVMNYMTKSPPPTPSKQAATGPKPAPATVARSDEVTPQLAEQYPPWNADMRQRLTEALRGLADKAGLGPLPQMASVEELLNQVQARLAIADQTPLATRFRLAHIRRFEQPEQKLRGLLWAYEIKEYNDPKLNRVELVERLQKKLVAENARPG